MEEAPSSVAASVHRRAVVARAVQVGVVAVAVVAVVAEDPRDHRHLQTAVDRSCPDTGDAAVVVAAAEAADATGAANSELVFVRADHLEECRLDQK